MNPGDNSGVEFRSDARFWDPATLGRLALSLYFPAGLLLPVWHPHQPWWGWSGFPSSGRRVGDPGGSLRECSQAQVSSAPGVQLISCSSPSLGHPGALLPPLLASQTDAQETLGMSGHGGKQEETGLGTRVSLKQHCTQHSN